MAPSFPERQIPGERPDPLGLSGDGGFGTVPGRFGGGRDPAEHGIGSSRFRPAVRKARRMVRCIVLAGMVGACAPPREAVRRETALGHPLASPREGLAVAVLGDLQGPTSGERSSGSGQTERARGQEESRRSVPPSLSATAPAGGDVAASLMSSARRLLGIRGSFDQRSFLGHLLRVCDLLPAGAGSQDWTAGTSLKRARESGTLGPVDRAVPGHLLFFPCEGRCGPMEADGGGACVVMEAGPEGGRCIGYLQGEVRWLRFGHWHSQDPEIGRVAGSSPPLEP